ncbi:MAG: 50S ribosomal protein L17 [Oligoflexales bacterium]|nr:50S ribosomal protein L17 [Oligoflexales bacterium]
MRHGHGYVKLGRRSDHRRALLRNLATSFFLHGRIKTTVPKAKALRPLVERMITLGKRGDLHARRRVASYLFDGSAVRLVFSDLSGRFKDRKGGYTRITKLGERFGDGADMCFFELVDFTESSKKKQGVDGTELESKD